MRKILAIFIGVLCCGISSAQLYVNADFNTGTLAQNIFILSCIGPNNPGFLSDSFVTTGKCFYASVSKSDSICGNSNRTELNISSANFASTEWMYWETLIPTWVPTDTRPFSSGQIHGSFNVPFSLWFINGNLEAHIQSSTTNNSALTVNATYYLGAFTKGVWQKNLIHFKRSSGSDGFFEMWINGVWKFRYDGPTSDIIAGNAELAWYAKYGIYSWNLAISAYNAKASATDNIKHGGAASVLTDFFPVTGTAPTKTLKLPIFFKKL